MEPGFDVLAWGFGLFLAAYVLFWIIVLGMDGWRCLKRRISKRFIAEIEPDAEAITHALRTAYEFWQPKPWLRPDEQRQSVQEITRALSLAEKRGWDVDDADGERSRWNDISDLVARSEYGE